LAFVFAVMQSVGVTLRLERNSDATPVRKLGPKAGGKQPPYSIDDIADGGVK
jgi:hypothetical protein